MIGRTEAESERLMLGLRRSAGVALGSGGTDLVESAAGRRLLEAGIVDVRNGRLVVSRPLLTDMVIREALR